MSKQQRRGSNSRLSGREPNALPPRHVSINSYEIKTLVLEVSAHKIWCEISSFLIICTYNMQILHIDCVLMLQSTRNFIYRFQVEQQIASPDGAVGLLLEKWARMWKVLYSSFVWFFFIKNVISVSLFESSDDRSTSPSDKSKQPYSNPEN